MFSSDPRYVSHADLQRLLRRVGVNDVSDAEVREMIAAANTNPRQRQAAIRPEQLLKLVPPLCPYKHVDNQVQTTTNHPDVD